MNELQVTKLLEFYDILNLKLEPLIIILQNIQCYLTSSNSQMQQSNDVHNKELLLLNTQMLKKLTGILKNSQSLKSIEVTKKGSQKQEDFILFEILDNILQQLSFDQEIQNCIIDQLQLDLTNNVVNNNDDEIELLNEEMSMLKLENKQLKDEIQLWHQTIEEEQQMSEDVSELVRCLSDKDKYIEELKESQMRLLQRNRLDSQTQKHLERIFAQLEQYEKVVRGLQETLSTKEEQYQRRLLYNEITNESLREQIHLSKERMKKFKKRVPLLFEKEDSNGQNHQVSNIYQVLVQLEEETFKMHQNYQNRIATYTLESNELRQKVNSLEKMINVINQSQSDNQQIIAKMKVLTEKLQEQSFQNDQMRQILKDKSALEKRIKDLIKMEQKEKEQKEKELKEQKKKEKEEKEKKEKEEKDKKKFEEKLRQKK